MAATWSRTVWRRGVGVDVTADRRIVIRCEEEMERAAVSRLEGSRGVRVVEHHSRRVREEPP